LGRVYGEKQILTLVNGTTWGVSAIVWFKNTEAESEKNTVYILNKEAINKFQYTTSVQNYIKPCHFGAIKVTEHF